MSVMVPNISALRPVLVAPLKCLQQRALRMRSTDSVETKTAWDTARPFSEIPGPKPLPLIGNIWRFLPLIGDFRHVKAKDMMKEMSRRYGPISQLGVAPFRKPVIVVEDPDEIQNVFRNEGIWPVREGVDAIRYYYGEYCSEERNSLVAEQGKAWQEFRTAVNQVMMRPKTVLEYVNPTAEVSNEFIDRIRKMRDHNSQMPANFSDELSKWSLESITLVALDTRLGALNDSGDDSEANRMVKCARNIFKCAHALDFGFSPWKYVSTPTYRKLIASMNQFSEMSAKHVNNAIARLKSIPEGERADRPYSVLERLLLNGDDPQKGVDMAMDMILGGVDTTSMMTSIVMYHLASHPEIQRTLQEELDRVLPDPRAPLTTEAFQQLKYVRACIKESFRFEPIAVGNSRTTVKDMVIAGYQVPKGTRTILNHGVLVKSEQYVPRAQEYLPERWLPGSEALRPKHPFVLLPFGFGPRMCVGRRFADMEMEVFLALLFRQCNVEWHHPPPEMDMKLVLRYASPLHFTITDRI